MRRAPDSPTSRLLEPPEIAYFSSSISLASAPFHPVPSVRPTCSPSRNPCSSHSRPPSHPSRARRPGVEVNQFPQNLPPTTVRVLATFSHGYSRPDYSRSGAIWLILLNYHPRNGTSRGTGVNGNGPRIERTDSTSRDVTLPLVSSDFTPRIM